LWNCFAFVPLALLQGIGRPDLPAKFYLLELPLYVGAAWFLIPKLGIAGAALAWALRVALDAVLLFGGALVAYRISPRLLCERGVMQGLTGLAVLGASFWAVSKTLHSLPTQAAGVATLAIAFALGVYAYALDFGERASVKLAIARLTGWTFARPEE
jgi:O-antigen/teichoic acid export membrane protein